MFKHNYDTDSLFYNRVSSTKFITLCGSNIFFPSSKKEAVINNMSGQVNKIKARLDIIYPLQNNIKACPDNICMHRNKMNAPSDNIRLRRNKMNVGKDFICIPTNKINMHPDKISVERNNIYRHRNKISVHLNNICAGINKIKVGKKIITIHFLLKNKVLGVGAVVYGFADINPAIYSGDQPNKTYMGFSPNYIGLKPNLWSYFEFPEINHQIIPDTCTKVTAMGIGAVKAIKSRNNN